MKEKAKFWNKNGMNFTDCFSNTHTHTHTHTHTQPTHTAHSLQSPICHGWQQKHCSHTLGPITKFSGSFSIISPIKAMQSSSGLNMHHWFLRLRDVDRYRSGSFLPPSVVMMVVWGFMCTSHVKLQVTQQSGLHEGKGVCRNYRCCKQIHYR